MSILKVNPLYNITSFNGIVNLTRNGVNSLFSAIRSQNILDNILYGDITKWLISLMFFPMRIYSTGSTVRRVKLGSNVLDTVSCYAMDQKYQRSYYLNSVQTQHVVEKDNYMYTDPYCSAEMYLPFYGKFSIPMEYLLSNAYINIYLSIDVISGGAKYTVTCSNVAPAIQIGKNAEATETRSISYFILPIEYVLGEYPFQLGYEVPVNTTGEASRRTAFAIQALSTVASVASLGASTFAGAAITAVVKTATTTTVDQVGSKTRGPKTTGRSTTTTQSTTESTTSGNTASKVATFTNASIQNSLQLLESLSLPATSQNVSSPSLHLNASTKIQLVIRKKKFVEVSPKLFGRPYGKYVQLNSLNGFATIGNIIFEDFPGTQEELSELKSMLAEGVVF